MSTDLHIQSSPAMYTYITHKPAMLDKWYYKKQGNNSPITIHVTTTSHIITYSGVNLPFRHYKIFPNGHYPEENYSEELRTGSILAVPKHKRWIPSMSVEKLSHKISLCVLSLLLDSVVWDGAFLRLFPFFPHCFSLYGFEYRRNCRTKRSRKLIKATKWPSTWQINPLVHHSFCFWNISYPPLQGFFILWADMIQI